MMRFLHDPGSPGAIDQGCRCPPQDGPGAAIAADGRPAYLCDAQCPLHGIEAALAAVGAWPAGEPANDND